MKLVPCFILDKKGYFLVDSGLLLELVAFLSFQHSQAVFISDKKVYQSPISISTPYPYHPIQLAMVTTTKCSEAVNLYGFVNMAVVDGIVTR